MLQQMRSGAASWIAKGLMVLLVLSFGAWGVADYIRNFNTGGDVAKVGDQAITQAEFSESWRREVSTMQRRFGPNFNAEQARQLGLDETVLNRMVEDKLYEQAARDMGISISEKDVRDAIMNAPAFRDPSGQFNRLAFESYLRNEGYSEGMLVAVLRGDLARTRLLGSLFGTVTGAPQLMTYTMLGYRLERRLAEYVVIDAAKLPPPAVPADDKIEDYYKANPKAFTAPERRDLSWFTLTPEDLAAKTEVSDAELHDEYEANKQAYETPEKRTVEQVVFTTEAEAKAAYEAVQKGEDFLAMAARTQKLKPADVSLGSVTKADLPAAIATPIFALAPNTVSQPVRSPFGWHLARVTAVQPGSTKTFDQAKAELHEQIALRKAGDAMVKLRAKIDDQIAGGAMLDEIAKTDGATVKTVANIDAGGKDKAGKPTADLPQSRDFLTQAFDMADNSEPQIVDLAGGGLAVVKATGITPAAVRPLAEVKDDVVKALLQRARATAAQDKAKEIADAVRGGGDLARLAAAAGAVVQLSPPLLRSGQPADRNVSPVLVSALFGAKAVGDVVTGPATTPGGAVVARLSGIQPADPADLAKQTDAVSQQLGGGMAQDLVQEYRQVLQAEYGVKIDATARARAAGL
ncbi:SurA N-terminal domain-containing protein [Ferrovibrio xuzhouensis]|uniref:Parvulin-like PPIase n=1 Tax=Ferrovibrio xuzhouensis TaxID=1576914 RepID=A0ABV7VLP1_9PROT